MCRIVSLQRDGKHQILICLEHLEETGHKIEVDLAKVLKNEKIHKVEEFYLGKFERQFVFWKFRWRLWKKHFQKTAMEWSPERKARR